MKNGQAQALSNWSGDIQFTPGKVEIPSNEQDLQHLIRQARAEGLTIRALGAGHSCAPIVETNQVIVQSDHFKGLHYHDAEKCIATVGAGMTVEETGESLFAVGLGMQNTGHIDKQVLAGAISTGTHGAGKNLTNLSGQIIGLRMVTGAGEIRS